MIPQKDKNKINAESKNVYDRSINKQWPNEDAANFSFRFEEGAYFGYSLRDSEVEGLKKEIERLRKLLL